MLKKRKNEPISHSCINASVIECFKCKKIKIVPYSTNKIVFPLDPSGFTEQQIDIARNEGCILRESIIESSKTPYLATVCPACTNLMGDFFYHDLSRLMETFNTSLMTRMKYK